MSAYRKTRCGKRPNIYQLRDRVNITCTACRHLWASFSRFSVVNNSKYSQVFLRYSLGRTGQISSQI